VPVSGPPARVRRLRARLGGDRGAVAVLVALLLGSGVLLGMAALVVDVGNLYAERRQLQGGADAAAIKVAQICAGPTGCIAPSTPIAEYARDYASDNANDEFASATVCGRGGGLSACDPPVGKITDCIGPPPQAGDYVEVHTKTRNPDGTSALPPVFAQAVLGGFEGAEVEACARVAWGPPARSKGLAMTISICDWERGKAFPNPPVEQVIAVYDETDPASCVAAGGSAASRGGFRWLKDADQDCRITTSVGKPYEVTTGDSKPNNCDERDDLMAVRGRPVLVPVFDSISGGGGNAEYVVDGIGAFVVTGWKLPGSTQASSISGLSTCENNENSCIYGYFTQAVLPGSGAVGGPDRGAKIVALVG
jgi:Putative Flp pilus-assembly TadE/G-like